MSDMLTIIYIAGLGQDPKNEDLHGMRPLLVWLTEKYTPSVGFIVLSHADAEVQKKIDSIQDDRFLIGHSNGGEEEHRADGLAKQSGRTFAGELYLDAKPEWDNFQGVVDWLNPTYQYTLPVATDTYHAFYGGFGRPFFTLKESTKLSIAHADFPGAPEVHSWIENFVDEWAAK
jgi:hypothetical protein